MKHQYNKLNLKYRKWTFQHILSK